MLILSQWFTASTLAGSHVNAAGGPRQWPAVAVPESSIHDAAPAPVPAPFRFFKARPKAQRPEKIMELSI
jgi:hypothetical protein